MSRHGKKYFNALKKAPKKAVSLQEAIKMIAGTARNMGIEVVE